VVAEVSEEVLREQQEAIEAARIAAEEEQARVVAARLVLCPFWLPFASARVCGVCVAVCVGVCVAVCGCVYVCMYVCVCVCVCVCVSA
jgi:hypothetical protein